MIIINKVYLMFEEFEQQNQNVDDSKRIGSVKNARTGAYLTEMSIKDFKKTVYTGGIFVEIPHIWEKSSK